MKCHWTGKPVEQAPRGCGFYSVVVHPSQSIDEKTMYALSRASGLSAMDLKVRARPNGYFMLCKSQNQSEMLTALKRVLDAGMMATLFDDSTLYYAPPMKTALSVRVEEHEIYFLDSRGNPVFGISRDEKILKVISELSVHNKRPFVHTYLRPNIWHGGWGWAVMSRGCGSVAGRSYREKTQEFARIQDTVPVCIIFNLSRLTCVEIMLSDFDFSAVPGMEHQASTFKNFDTLSQHIQNLSHLTPDFHYPHSFLPVSHDLDYTKQSIADQPEPRTKYIKQSAKTGEREFEQFRCYARFRYIMEAFINAENKREPAQQ